jgi:hypothetical protein
MNLEEELDNDENFSSHWCISEGHNTKLIFDKDTIGSWGKIFKTKGRG